MERDESDLIAFRDCFARNGTNRRLDALRWQYDENPTRKILVDLALCEDRIAAIYAVQPAGVRVGGVRGLAAQSVDTLVDADFRGRGLFTTMADGVYARMREHGGLFVYGFPNASSAPGFFGKLQWSSLDPVPFLVRPLRTTALASKLPFGKLLGRLPDVRLPIWGPRLRGDQELRAMSDLGPELDLLWDRFAAHVTVAVDRSVDYLRWRLSKPGQNYECLGMFEGGQLVGFCAYTTVDKHGARIGYVLELLYEPERHQVGAALLAESLRRMAADLADVALAWCFSHSPNARAHSKVGFVPLPERLRPIELHFGVRVLDESLTEVLTDRGNWYISYCNSDTV
jgi:GNAT superfamily N-acetyltransferase